MPILSTLALRPDEFSPRDLPDLYVAEGENFVAFGPESSKLLLASLPTRRYVHPDNRHLNALPDFATPRGPQEAFMVLDNLGDGDYAADPIEFILNDYEDADYDSIQGGGYRIRSTWKQKYVEIQTKTLDCCHKILRQFPSEGVEDEGRGLLRPLSDDTWVDLIRVYESFDEVADVIYSLKMEARLNLGELNYLMHSQPSWWRRALDADDQAFVDSLRLPERPTRGCFINLLSDWSHINIPLLLRANVPFAYVWSEAVNAQPRFDRLDSAVLTGYYWARCNSESEPSTEDIPAIVYGKKDATSFDHFLQDKRARTRGSPSTLYDPKKTYVVQFHEGWKCVPLKDPEAIQRSLDRYEWYEKDPGGGAAYVVIEAWSMRDADEGSVRATYEFGSVATQTKNGEKLGERVDLTVDERREMYRLRCAPWGGGRYDALTGEVLQAVPLDKPTALVELERLFYPRTPVLEHSVLPPSPDEHHGDEGSTPYLVTRLSDPETEGEESARNVTAASLIRRMGGFAKDTGSPPPTTHSSWRTDTASDLPFSESMGRRRSASPRRGVRIPDAPAGFVVPDPLRIVRDDVAQPGSPLWQQRYTILRSAFPSLLRSLSPRDYPREDHDFFKVKWVWDFLHNGYLRFPLDADRLRVYLWLETQGVRDAADLLRLCLLAGVRFEAGVSTDTKLPEAAREIVGEEPDHFKGEYLQFKDGGGELYADYKSMVKDLCRLEQGPSFVYHGGFVSAIAAHYGADILKDRVGTGVHLATRLYKTGKVRHPYGLREEIIFEKLSERDINKMLGLVIGRDGKKLHWLFPPPDLWAELWPGSGEWNEAEESYFLDIVNGLENGTRTALSRSRWEKQLTGRRNSLQREYADRRQPAMSLGTARAWVALFDWAYEVKEGSLKLSWINSDYRVRRLPLFR